MEACRERLISNPVEVVDDWIDTWHHDPSTNMPLRKWLGMTKEEYQKFVVCLTDSEDILNKMIYK